MHLLASGVCNPPAINAINATSLSVAASEYPAHSGFGCAPFPGPSLVMIFRISTLHRTIGMLGYSQSDSDSGGHCSCWRSAQRARPTRQPNPTHVTDSHISSGASVSVTTTMTRQGLGIRRRVQSQQRYISLAGCLFRPACLGSGAVVDRRCAQPPASSANRPIATTTWTKYCRGGGSCRSRAASLASAAARCVVKVLECTVFHEGATRKRSPSQRVHAKR